MALRPLAEDKTWFFGGGGGTWAGSLNQGLPGLDPKIEKFIAMWKKFRVEWGVHGLGLCYNNKNNNNNNKTKQKHG